MIRKINFTVENFIKNYLPIAKRKPIRLNYLSSLLFVFATLRSEYMAWRDEAIIRANVTGETMSLEWYLNYICASGTGITIETAGLSGLRAGIESTELAYYVAAGIESTEPTRYVSIGFPGESTLWGTKSFIVKVPTAFSSWSAIITSIVNSYRMAGHSFKIVLY